MNTRERTGDNMGRGTLIELAGVSVGFEDKTVLRSVSLNIPRTGCVGLMGPGGVGKSTLLRTLARWNEVLPSFWVHGEIRFDGRDFIQHVPLSEAQRLVPLLAQKASLTAARVVDNAIAGLRGAEPIAQDEQRRLAESALSPLGMWDEYEPVLERPVLDLTIGQMRRLAVARLVAPGAAVLLADEPLRDLDEREAAAMEALLALLSERMCVVLITHDQRAARRLCDTVCLITAGRVVEVAPMKEFFSAPKTELGETFIRSGNCWPAADDIEPQVQQKNWIPTERERRRTPRSFHWVIDRVLGGTQWPGLLGDEHGELGALARLGCKHLVSLTEAPFCAETLAGHGIRGFHFPIDDMTAPTLDEMEAWAALILEWIDGGIPTVVHCRAGLGRTGTVLACLLVSRGHNAVRAIEEVRRINSYYIQNREQSDFVRAFEGRVAARLAGQ